MSKRLTPKFATEGKHECQNCGENMEAALLNDICDIAQRVAVGEPVPSGECPYCGALCHPVQPKRKNSLPSILIAVNGGTVQGVRSTIPVHVKVWDGDDKEAEGMTGDEADKDYDLVAKGYPVEAY